MEEPSRSSSLPSLYGRWVEEFLGTLPQEEVPATCDECAMCSSIGPTDDSFNPRTKCCTYHPALPNFLVGRILSNEDGRELQARTTVVELVARRARVTPLELAPPRPYELVFKHARHAWGRSLAQRCPFFDEDGGGRCGIWTCRASVCATWFCKHVRGETGRQFWESLRNLLGTVESALSLWCVLQLEVGATSLDELLPRASLKHDPELNEHDLDQSTDAHQYRKLWGRYHGRETEFFEMCSRLVARLSWADIVRLAGPPVGARAQIVVSAWQRLKDLQVPRLLKTGTFNLGTLNMQTAEFTTYSATDSLRLPRELVAALPYFDGGRTTDEAVAAIQEDLGLRLDNELVRLLVDFQILVPAQAGESEKREDPEMPENPEE